MRRIAKAQSSTPHPCTAYRRLLGVFAVAAVLLWTPSPGSAQSQREMPRAEPGQYQRPEAAREAVETVKTAPVDLILMDVRMAAMSGIEALKAIKAKAIDAQVIMITTETQREAVAEALVGVLPDHEPEIRARLATLEQWMDVDFPYWEGAVTASGSGPGERGVGYMELTGYPETDR